MKRPQSAKQVQNYWAQASNDEGTVKESSRPFLKFNSKPQMNIVASNNDFSRLLPKRIQYDKQKLYCEALYLKSSLNEVQEENHRLKTKIAILQKQSERKQKKQDQFQRGNTAASRPKLVDKDNGIVANLKRLVRQSKQQSENYKKDLGKVRRALRYTKLNELQVQKQTIYTQNRNLAKIIQQLQTQLANELNRSEENQNLALQFQNTLSRLKQVEKVNQNYEDMLQQLQMKNSELAEKLLVVGQKFERDLAIQRRKTDLLTKQNESLRRQNRQTTQRFQQQKKRDNGKKAARPTSSHPQSHTPNSRNDQHQKLKLSYNKQKQVAMEKNVKLQTELQQAKKKLAVSETQLKEQLKYNNNTLNLSNQPFQLQLTKNQIGQLSSHTQRFNTDKSKIQHKKANDGKNQAKIKRGGNKSQVFRQISQILTYRMKYNRYTFTQLKGDIQATPFARITCKDLLTMLTEKPFSLTPYYAAQFLKICYSKPKLSNDQQIESEALIDCLRDAIQEFDLIDEHQQEQMLYKIAECLTKQRQEMFHQFQKLKAKNKCVSKRQMCEILSRYSSLSSAQIDLVISYVSMGCQSLQRINYVQVLDKFYLNNSNSKSLSNSQNYSKHSRQKESSELSLGEDQHLSQDQQLYGEDQII